MTDTDNQSQTSEKLDLVPAIAGMLVLFVGAWAKLFVFGTGITIFEEILLFILGMECVHLFRSRNRSQKL